MGSKIVITVLVGIIVLQLYTNVRAGFDDDDIVGEIDCIIRDINVGGLEITRVDAIGYLTEID